MTLDRWDQTERSEIPDGLVRLVQLERPDGLEQSDSRDPLDSKELAVQRGLLETLVPKEILEILDFQDSQDHLEIRDLQDQWAELDNQDLLALLEIPDRLDQLVHLALLEIMDPLAAWDSQVQSDQMAIQVPKVAPVSLGSLAVRVDEDSLDRLVLRDQLEPQDQLAIQEHQVRLDSRDQLDYWEHPASQDSLAMSVRLAQLEQLDLWVSRVSKEARASQGQLVSLEHLVSRALKVTQEQKDHVDLVGQMVWSVRLVLKALVSMVILDLRVLKETLDNQAQQV